MKALVADDSMAVRGLIAEMLEESGFEVAQAADGAQALAFLGNHPDTDLLLTDWNMPKVTGLELLTAVRADAFLNHIRVVMVTMERDFDNVRRAFLAGAADYVLKPCTMSSLREKLRALGFQM